MSAQPPLFSPEKQRPRTPTTQQRASAPVAQMQRHTAGVPPGSAQYGTPSEVRMEMARHFLFGPQPPVYSQSELDLLRAIMESGRVSTMASGPRGLSNIDNMRRETFASTPQPRFSSTPQPAQSSSSARCAPLSSSRPILPAEDIPNARNLQRTPGRKRPKTDAGTTSTGRKTSNEFPAEVVRRAQGSTDRNQRQTRPSVHSSPIRGEDDMPSSRPSVSVARQLDFSSDSRVGSRHGTPGQKTPQPSIESPSPARLSRMRPPVLPSGDNVESSSIKPIPRMLRAPTAPTLEAQQSVDDGAKANSQPPSETDRYEYIVPDTLRGVKEAMGSRDWAQYMQLMEKFVEGEVDEKQLDREEKALFQAQDSKLRSRIRRLVNEMVAKHLAVSEQSPEELRDD